MSLNINSFFNKFKIRIITEKVITNSNLESIQFEHDIKMLNNNMNRRKLLIRER